MHSLSSGVNLVIKPSVQNLDSSLSKYGVRACLYVLHSVLFPTVPKTLGTLRLCVCLFLSMPISWKDLFL